MLQQLTHYYGIDWAAMACTFLTIYYLGKKQRIGFAYGMASNVFWAIFGIMAGSLANPISNCFLIALNIRGWLKWKASETP